MNCWVQCMAVSLLVVAGGCGSREPGGASTGTRALGVTLGDVIYLVGVPSGRCVGVAGGSTADQAALELQDCSGATSQQLRLETAEGYYVLRVVGSDRCLAVSGASTSPGASIVQATCSGASQQWSGADLGGGAYRITSRASGMAIDAYGAGTAGGTKIVQWPENGGANQQWRVVAASDVRSYTLTIATSGSGTTSPAPGTYTVPAGTTGAVTATPASGTTFTGWSGAATGTTNPLTVTVNGDMTLTASFAPGGSAPTGHFQMEDLDRGVVAVKISNGVYVGWRMQGYEYSATDPGAISYDVYRDGARIATVADSTNYLDASGSAGSTYTVRAVVRGVEQGDSKQASTWAQNHLRIPLQIPPGGTVPANCSNSGEAYTYSANDASPGDVDGDGQYEIVLKWDPSNSKDNSQSGCTGDVYLDAYRLDGTRLWRIDLGRNIRAGAHYTQLVVYDLDGDGKAELAVKTAPGTRDGTGAYLRLGPAASADHSADYRNSSGYVLTGPEYLTVFSGATGAELATVSFDVPRGTVSAWGDSYGNRVDRFLASAAFVSDSGGETASGRPSVLMARGYYTRATVTAWNWRDGKLTEAWKADSDAGTAYAGQGAHSMAVADVDGDGAQEIIYGASTIDSDGTRRCSTGFGHGDALHVGDLVPSRPGLEVFLPHESSSQPSWDVHDASTCAVIARGPVTGGDTGRGVADDVFAGSAGAEVWTSNGEGLLSAATGASVGSQPGTVNFLVWWDGDESRELENNVSVSKYGGSTLLTCSQCASNNSTKSTPALTADLLGDWREEVVWREADSSALRLYTTTALTGRRIYTLMHDPQYRMQVTSEQTAYNQPPHPSFHIGSGMAPPPVPDIHVR